MSSAVEFRDVFHNYVSGIITVEALRGINLAIQAGEMVAIMGPSGSGKSTLLRIAGGLERPTQGRVMLWGTSLHDQNASALAALRRREIGYVFQEYNLVPSLTVAENAALPLELDGVSVSSARTQAMTALSSIGMDCLADRFPDDLSGGEQQQTAIARAIVGERNLILADEPTGALDTLRGEEIMRLLRGLCDSGRTALFVTHDASHAAWADRVLFLRDGRLVDEARHAGPESLLAGRLAQG